MISAANATRPPEGDHRQHPERGRGEQQPAAAAVDRRHRLRARRAARARAARSEPGQPGHTAAVRAPSDSTPDEHALVGQLGEQPRQAGGAVGAPAGAGLAEQRHEVVVAVEQLGQLGLLGAPGARITDERWSLSTKRAPPTASDSSSRLSDQPERSLRLAVLLPAQPRPAHRRLLDDQADPGGHRHRHARRRPRSTRSATSSRQSPSSMRIPGASATGPASRAAVDERPIARARILERGAVLVDNDLRMRARDTWIVEHADRDAGARPIASARSSGTRSPPGSTRSRCTAPSRGVPQERQRASVRGTWR